MVGPKAPGNLCNFHHCFLLAFTIVSLLEQGYHMRWQYRRKSLAIFEFSRAFIGLIELSIVARKFKNSERFLSMLSSYWLWLFVHDLDSTAAVDCQSFLGSIPGQMFFQLCNIYLYHFKVFKEWKKYFHKFWQSRIRH